MNSQEEIADYFKTKRDQYVFEIKKTKKIQAISAKRAKLACSLLDKENALPILSQYPNQTIHEIFDNLAASFFGAFKSQDHQNMTKIVMQFRQILSSTENPPILELVITGAVPKIVELLDAKYHKYEDLLIETTWTIANIASGDSKHVDYLVGLDIIPKLIELLEHSNIDLRENIIWTLSNIAGDSTKNRDALLEKNVVRKIGRLLENKKLEPSLVPSMIWLVSNLCRGKPYPEYCEVAPFLPVLQTFLLGSKDKEVLDYCLLAISCLSNGDKDQIEDILALDVVERILELMESNDISTKALALKIVGNLLTGEDDQIQYLIHRGVIGALVPFLSHPKKQFKKEACWAFSNIMACTFEQIQEVINYKDGSVIKKIFELVSKDEPDVVQEGVFCICNITCGGTFEHIQFLVNQGFFEVIIDVLKRFQEVEMIKPCLEALQNVLLESQSHFNLYEPDQNPYIIKLEQCGGLKVIEKLQRHPDTDVYNLVIKFIETNLNYE